MKKKNDPQLTPQIISLGFLILYIFAKLNWAIWIALIFGLIGVFAPFLSAKIDYLWMKLADLLGWIMHNLILGIVFYMFLFPIAFLSRLLGRKDNLQLKLKINSTYTEVNRIFDSNYFEKPW